MPFFVVFFKSRAISDHFTSIVAAKTSENHGFRNFRQKFFIKKIFGHMYGKG